MSEIPNSDNANTSDSTDSVNRRRILKALGVTAGTAAFGGFSVGGVSAASNDQSFSVSSAALKTADSQPSVSSAGASEATDPTVAALDPTVSDLIDLMESETGLTADRESNIYISVQTDNEEANSYEPQVSVIPLGTEQDSTSVYGSSDDGAGFLFVMTALDDGSRVPVAVSGLTATPVSGSSDYTRQLYGLEDESPAVVESETVAGPNAGSSSGDFTTMDTIPCAACQVVVSGLCTYGGGIIGDYACTAACSAAFGANFIAIFGCASICSALSTAVAAVGCTTGDKAICIYAQNHSPVGFGC